MPGKFSTSKFNSFLPQIDFINHQFSQRKVKIHPQSRYAKYINCMQALANAKSKVEYDSIIEKYGMPLILQSFLEGSEIYGVLKEFEKESDEKFEPYLKKILSGPYIPDLSENKTESRDIMFELNMAARFRKANIICDLVEPDLKIKHEGHVFFVACKRPQRLGNLEANIRKARRQISSKGIGLIALSLDKYINPNTDVLQGNTMEDLAEQLKKEIDKFRKYNGKQISIWASDRKVLGVIYSLCLIGSIETPNIFVSCQQIDIRLYCSPNSPYYKIIKSISNNFVALDH
jgi:hypothetical protein